MKLLITLVLVALVAATPVSTRSNQELLTVVGEFPYLVRLQMFSDNGDTAWCSGTLIANRWVLTAKVCTMGVDGVNVYVRTNDTFNSTMVNVSKRNIIQHNSENTIDGISLIELPVTFIKYTKYIQVAMLPGESAANSTYVCDKTISSSVERIVENDIETISSIGGRVVANADCKNYYTNFDEFKICTRQTSLCNNKHLGGPLVLADSNRTIIGVSLFSVCMDEVPVLYALITKYLDWIREHTGITTF